jgi:hypothetical protein
MDEADGEEPSILDGGDKLEGDVDKLLVACTTCLSALVEGNSNPQYYSFLVRALVR